MTDRITAEDFRKRLAALGRTPADVAIALNIRRETVYSWQHTAPAKAAALLDKWEAERGG